MKTTINANVGNETLNNTIPKEEAVMTKQYSYTPEIALDNEKPEPVKKAPKVTVSKPATPGQLGFIETLLKQTGVTGREVITFAEASAEIQRLQKLPTKRMIDHILAKVAVLKINMPEEVVKGMSKIEAGDYIAKLSKIEEEHPELLPVTDSQIETMVSMFLCPSVDFGDIPTKRLVAENTYAILTANEFAEELKKNFDKKTAFDFINKYKPDYLEWKKNRITVGLAKRIKALEEMLNTSEDAVEKEIAVDEMGNLISVNKRKTHTQKGMYNKLTDEQIRQFDKASALKYIEQLEYDLNRKDMKKTTLTPQDGSETFEAFRKNTEEHSIGQELVDTIYKLSAMLGYEFLDDIEGTNISEIREAIKELISDKTISLAELGNVMSNEVFSLIFSK